MRSEYEALKALGVLPDEDSATEAVVDAFDELIENAPSPLTHEEADVLWGVLGSDLCFGVAWGAIHKLESMVSENYAAWIESVNASTYCQNLLVSRWERTKTS